MKESLIKVFAWVVLIVCIILALGALAMIVVAAVFINGANLLKLITVDSLIVLLAALILLIGVGLFETVYQGLSLEVEIKKLEDQEHHKNSKETNSVKSEEPTNKEHDSNG